MTEEVQSATKPAIGFSWARWIPLGIFVVVMAFLSTSLTKDPRDVPSVLIDKPAPVVVLPDLLDLSRTVDSSVMQGQLWLLNVWGTWCPECWKEHEMLMYLANQQGISIFGIDWRDDADEARDFLVKYGNPFKYVGFDAQSKSIIDWGVYGAPETFLIDKQGKIRWKHKGAITQDIWINKLKPLMQKLEQG